MDVVYAVETAVVQMPAGGQATVRAGQHWPADDPLVLSHPHLFATDPRHGLAFSARPASMDDAPVEQTTAGPGEKRSAVRRG